MNSQSASGKLRAFFDTLLIGLFLVLLWLPTLDHFFKLDHSRPTAENRRPARWPQLGGIGQSREFIAGVENYFNDHFGFRKLLIYLNNHLKGRLFNDTSGREVLIGREGWLFYSGDAMLEHWNREKSLSFQDLENWRRLLEMRRDWLLQRGCKYILVVPPDKHTVYPEYLPDWMEKSAKPSDIHQLVQYMEARSTVEVLDLSQALIDAKKMRVNYLKTDTHWNLFGSFVAYQALLNALDRQLPGLKPLPLDTYDWKLKTEPPGDLAVMLGRTDSYTETAAVEALPVKPLPAVTLLYNRVGVPEGENKEHAPCYTLNEEASGKAIVFRDSFAINWYPLLGQHFREVIYVWQYEWDRALIEREKPDVVIDEMVERFFNLQNPVVLARKDQLPASRSISALP
jgi:hypothetical protein